MEEKKETEEVVQTEEPTVRKTKKTRTRIRKIKHSKKREKRDDGVPTIKELSSRLGFEKSEHFLEFIGYTAQNMSTTKKKNYIRYVAILKLAVIDRFGIPINDTISALEKYIGEKKGAR